MVSTIMQQEVKVLREKFFIYLILDRSDGSLSPPIDGVRIVGLKVRRLKDFGIGVVPTLNIGSILLHELNIRLEERG